MADRDENRFEQPPQDPNGPSYGQNRQQPDDNGCTYHSGRVNDWNRESEGSQNRYNSSTPYGAGPGDPDQRSQNSPPNYGMNQNGEYRYSYEDYNRISHNPSGPEVTGHKVGNGIKVFAVIVTVLLVVTMAILMGVILSRSQNSLSSSIPSQTVSQDPAPSETLPPESSAASREPAEVPELNITSHAQEDTYLSTDGKLTTT